MTTQFYKAVAAVVAAQGGFHNAHLRLDRANTLDDGFVDQGRLRVLENSYTSLQKKHALIQTVPDGPAYERDNLLARVADTCSPSTTANLMDEVFVLSAAIRFYHPQILGKLAAGATLTRDERDLIAEHLVKNDQEVAKVGKRWLGDAPSGFVNAG